MYKIIIIVSLLLLSILLVPNKAHSDNETQVATTTQKVLVAKIDPLLERIAKCESNNNPKAKNKYSSASGRFQFLWGSWYYYGLKYWGEEFYEKNIFDYEDNTELAKYVFSIEGSRPWASSKKCWSKPLNVG